MRVQKSMYLRLALLLAGFCYPAKVEAAEKSSMYQEHIRGLITQHCVACHGNNGKAKGDLILEDLQYEESNSKQQELWATILDLVEAGDMPPKRKDVAPLPEADRKVMMSWLQKVVASSAEDFVGRSMLRRLTRNEYIRSVAELFTPAKKHKSDPWDPSQVTLVRFFSQAQLPIFFYDPQTVISDKRNFKYPLPADIGNEAGLTTQGDLMSLTSEDMGKYLGAALYATKQYKKQGRQSVLRLPTDWSEMNLRNSPGATILNKGFATFASRAWRRPLTEAELQNLHAFYNTQLKNGLNYVDALRQVIAVILASPNFIYLSAGHQQNGKGVVALNDYDLAARLSYLFWQRAPDEQLRRLAKTSSLNNKDELTRQVRRLLSNPKAIGFIEGFCWQWVGANNIKQIAPDQYTYPEFYNGRFNRAKAHQLAIAMTREVLYHLQWLLVENRSLIELVDAPSGYLNQALAQYYGVEDRWKEVADEHWKPQVLEAVNKLHATTVSKIRANTKLDGDELTKALGRADRELQKVIKYEIGRYRYGKKSELWLQVAWPDRRRGGLLTMAGVLAATSSPTQHNTILRGNWLLLTMLNRPPPPPPADLEVESLEQLDQQQRGRLPMRTILAMHRAQSACAACHDRIDPYGLAFENYDGIGRYHKKRREQSIDASGQLTDGRAFDGPIAFKDLLLERRQRFVRGFVEHLLNYALGRAIVGRDRPSIDRILERTRARGYRFRDVLTEVVLSKPFRYIDLSSPPTRASHP